MDKGDKLMLGVLSLPIVVMLLTAITSAADRDHEYRMAKLNCTVMEEVK